MLHLSLVIFWIVSSSIDASAAEGDCEFSFDSGDGRNGTIVSPQYPERYQGGESCVYVFRGEEGERVQLEITEIDLLYRLGNPDDPYDCDEADKLVVYTVIEEEDSEIGIYCGRKSPPRMMSSGNTLKVTFTTNPGSTGRGFKASYKFVTSCTFVFDSDVSRNGSFTSPNYPGLYPRKTVCNYVFMGRGPDDRVNLTFPFFEVEGIPPYCDDSTQSDYVEFSNFPLRADAEDRSFSRACGFKPVYDARKAMGTVTSDGNFLQARFTSNDLFDEFGFDGFYQFYTASD